MSWVQAAAVTALKRHQRINETHIPLHVFLYLGRTVRLYMAPYGSSLEVGKRDISTTSQGFNGCQLSQVSLTEQTESKLRVSHKLTVSLIHLSGSLCLCLCLYPFCLRGGTMWPSNFASVMFIGREARFEQAVKRTPERVFSRRVFECIELCSDVFH